MDIFCNCVNNLKLGNDNTGSAGGFMEGTLSYTGEVSDPNKGNCDIEYYINLERAISDMGVHSLAVKDTVGLLTPRAATILVSVLMEELPFMPMNIHTHNTVGTGVASMIATTNAGSNIVDAAMEAMSGLTYQPSLGSITAAVRGTNINAGFDPD